MNMFARLQLYIMFFLGYRVYNITIKNIYDNRTDSTLKAFRGN